MFNHKISRIVFFLSFIMFVSVFAEANTLKQFQHPDEKNIGFIFETIARENLQILSSVSDNTLETNLLLYWIISTVLRYTMAVIGIVLLLLLFIIKQFFSFFQHRKN